MAAADGTTRGAEYDTEAVGEGDGRELAVVSHILHHPNVEELRGRPEAILAAIDDWSKEHRPLKTVGSDQDRGELVVDLITRAGPRVMAELGGYIGYSAIKFGSALKRAGGQKYFSFETNPEYAFFARSLIYLAGLADFIEIIIGSASASLEKLARANPSVRIDLLFIDHDNSRYLPDLRSAEQLCLLGTGSFVIAHNVLRPESRAFVSRMHGQDGGQSIVSSGSNQFSQTQEPNYQSRMFQYKLPTGETNGLMISQLK